MALEALVQDLTEAGPIAHARGAAAVTAAPPTDP
jgi:hypothetical protein